MPGDDGRWLRLLTLSLLYFVQGAPYGFQTACLPLILREAGLSFSALGAMKLLFLPWVLKPLYAPYIERTRSKDWWLRQTMLALGLTCFAAGLAADPQEGDESAHLTILSTLMLLLNLFSAAQDVATDSLAVTMLKPSELGAGNTVQVVAYKAGSVFAGGLLLWVRDLLGWRGMFACFGSVYFVCVGLFWRLGLARRRRDEKEDEAPPAAQDAASLFDVPGTWRMLAFVSFYKLCERAEQTYSLFLVDKRVPHAQMALWSTVMRAGSLLGSSYAGFLLSSSGADCRSLIVRYSALRTLPILGQLGLLWAWGTDPVSDPVGGRDSALMYLSFLLTTATLFCAGVVTTAAFTLMMGLSQTAPPSIQGTHYATLATFEVLGKLAFAAVAGVLIDWLGLRTMFALFVLLAAACVPAASALLKDLPLKGTKATAD